MYFIPNFLFLHNNFFYIHHKLNYGSASDGPILNIQGKAGFDFLGLIHNAVLCSFKTH